MAFTNDWTVTNNPADHSKFQDQPSFVRKVRTDIEERLKNMFYGFTSGETAEGVKYLDFTAQGSDPSAPAATGIRLYSKTISAAAELFIRHTTAGVIQVTSLGKWLLGAITWASAALGDMIYHDGTTPVRLAGNTTTTKKYLNQTGNGTVSAAPSWAAIAAGDLPDLDQVPIKTNGSFTGKFVQTAPTANRTHTFPDASLNFTGYKQVVFGSFAGDGVDNRDITIGFNDTSKTPDFVWLSTQPGGGGGHYMQNGMANGIAPSDGSSQPTGIKSFAANKFRVGTNAQANGVGNTIYWMAFGG